MDASFASQRLPLLNDLGEALLDIPIDTHTSIEVTDRNRDQLA